MPRVGAEVVVHTSHSFLRVFNGRHGKVVCLHDEVIEVAFDHFDFTADFKPEELEIRDDDEDCHG